MIHRPSFRVLVSAMLIAVLALLLALPSVAFALTPKEVLGKDLFYDRRLSTPTGQACAACHGPQVGFTGPDAIVNLTTAVYPGAVSTRYGNRKPPTAAYAGDSPILYYDASKGWTGGMFWDGRATGLVLGDPLAEQAQGPFLNPLEQNNASAGDVVNKAKHSWYARLFRTVWGPHAFDDVDLAYERIARSIAAYERSREVSAFKSKYDAYLKGKARLTSKEALGLELFTGKARCANCHVPPLFTDYTYDNLGVPKNPMNPFYHMSSTYNPNGINWVDEGLGSYLKSAGYPMSVYTPELGKQKVPTLRNVDKRPQRGFPKAFSHNGYFKSLEEIVHFYNTRDVAVVGWAPPEVPENVNTADVGNLGLTHDEEMALVAFMRTLTDGYRCAR